MSTKATEAGAIYATLTRGSIFALTRDGKTFEKGKPVPVTAEQKAYLEEHAVDVVSRPEEREEGEIDMPTARICKFTFSDGATS